MRIFVILMMLGAIGYLPIRWAVTPALRRYIGPRFVASFVILIFAGLFAPPYLFYLLCPAAMILLTRGRVDAMCHFVLLGALIPSLTFPLVIGGIYLIQLSTLDVLGVGLGLALLIQRDRTRVAKARGWTIEDAIVLLLYAVLYIASQRLAEGMNGLLRQMLSGGITLLLPYWLLRRNLRSIDEYRLIIGSLAVASFMLSVYAVYEATNSWSLFVAINQHLGVATDGVRNLMVRGTNLRASTSMQGALMLGCYLSVGWVAMICSRALVRQRIAWIAGIIVVLAGEMAAQSRGSMVCIALVAIVLLVTYRRPFIALAASAAAGCGAALLLAAARFSSRIAAFLNVDVTGQTAAGEYDYRQVLFRRGMEEAAKHRWTGSDIISVYARLQDIKQGQGIVDFVNTYLFIYLVAGLIGIVPIFLGLIWMFRRLIGAFRRSDDDATVAVRSFAVAAMIALLVQLAFMSFIDRMPVLFVLALAGCRLVTLTQTKGRAGKPFRPAAAAKRLRPAGLEELGDRQPAMHTGRRAVAYSASQHKVRPAG